MFSLPILETLVGWLVTVLTAGGLAVLFGLMVVESFGIPPLPSEVILPFAGYLVYRGVYPFGAAFAVALLGGLVGAFIAYAVGRYGRHWLARSGTGMLRLDPKHLAAMDAWFARRGEPAVAVGRLLPLVRAYISYPAGTARMDVRKFGAFTVIGAAPYALLLLYAGYVLGPHWTEIESTFRYLDVVAVVVVVLVLAYVALVWGGRVSTGWPPRFTRSSGSPRPAEDAPR
jgi:membrane protein DedA with SNARE-associated domain